MAREAEEWPNPANNTEVFEAPVITAHQAENHRRFEQALGRKARVAVEGDFEANTAAFVHTDGSETVAVTLSTLNASLTDSFVTYAAAHEREHIENGVTHSDFVGRLSEEQCNVIVSHLNLNSDALDATSVIEGFTDWRTGEHASSGYKDLVENAKKLDAFVRGIMPSLGGLKENFQKPRLGDFFGRLAVAANSLMDKAA